MISYISINVIFICNECYNFLFLDNKSINKKYVQKICIKINGRKNYEQFWKKYKFLRPAEIVASFLDNGNILLLREKNNQFWIKERAIISQKKATDRYRAVNGKNITYSKRGRFQIHCRSLMNKCFRHLITRKYF